MEQDLEPNAMQIPELLPLKLVTDSITIVTEISTKTLMLALAAPKELANVSLLAVTSVMSLALEPNAMPQKVLLRLKLVTELTTIATAPSMKALMSAKAAPKA